MDVNTRVLIGLGAAVAANCAPCFDHYYAKALELKITMENIKATLEVHGYSMKHLVKCTVMLADIDEWGSFNEVYKTFFSPPYPARSAFAASGLAVGARVEVECIAAR